MVEVVRWLACDTVTGTVLAALPDLRAGSPLERRLCDASTCDFELPIPLAGHGKPPSNWVSATDDRGWRRMLVAVLGDQPVWAGLITRRRRGTKATAKLSTVTPEGYLDVRYVGDHTWTQQDEVAVILAGLVGDANDAEGIGLATDLPATGTPRDRRYFDQDDKTVLAAAQELAGVVNGPEWTIDLAWNANQTAVVKTVRAAKRIGFASTTPVAVFSTEGDSSATYDLDEQYTPGKGANHIVAVSSGQGEVRPQSAPARDEQLLAAGVPRVEHRWSPSSSITQLATLNDHAARALALMGRGGQVITISARADADPRLGRDWHIGDDVGHNLVGHGHPGGLKGVARAVGWRWHVDSGEGGGTVEPLLLVPGEGVV